MDMIFRGSGARVNDFFDKNRLIKQLAEPLFDTGINYQFWSDKGQENANVKRNYFINKNFGGCFEDSGLVVVADK